MNADKKPRMKRIGRYWIERELVEEGYRLADIFDTDSRMIELPELFDPDKRRHVGWMLCPQCDEKMQVDLRRPVCATCDWDKDSDESVPCAA